MIKNIKFKKPTYLLLILLVGCDDFKSKLELERAFDRNNDGIEDITYEYDEKGYYEFIDRNFDNRVDQVNRFGLDHVILMSNFDEDLNGILETYTSYSKGSQVKTKVDTNGDGVYDLFYIYKDSILLYAEKFYEKESKIGKYTFTFGYPDSLEIIEDTSLTKYEFEKSRD